MSISSPPPPSTSKFAEILVDLAEDIEAIHVSMLEDLECLNESPLTTHTQTQTDLEDSSIPTAKQASLEIDSMPTVTSEQLTTPKPIPPPSLILQPLWATVKHWSIQPFTILTISNGLLTAIVAGIFIMRRRPAAALPRIHDIGLGYATREVIDRIGDLEENIDGLHETVKGLTKLVFEMSKKKGLFW